MIRSIMLALCLLVLIAHQRPAEYDEGYSLLITAGHPRPAWPGGVLHPATAQAALAGQASPAAIVGALRAGDVHPPLYFWALEYWRRLAGPGWFTARLLSVACALASLALVGRLARLTGRPPVPAMALTLLSYGFAYTGSIARDIAPALTLDLAGLALMLAATPPHPDPPHKGEGDDVTPSPLWGGSGWGAGKHPIPTAFAAGLCFGAASFTNYLAVFISLSTLACAAIRHPSRAATAALGLALFLPADYYMYAAQAASRAGQFAPATPAAIITLARDAGAALLGGLPLYAGAAAPLVAVALAVLLYAAARSAGRRTGARSGLLLAATAATPLGLLALGLIFHTTPIEIRYLAFSLPPAALLLSTAAPVWRAALLTAQAAAIGGLAFAPQTMQPQQRAAAQARAFAAGNPIILVPFGNDGVGIPAQFMQGAAPGARILLLRGPPPDLSAEPQILLATIAIDANSRAETEAVVQKFAADPCYRLTSRTALVTAYLNACAHQHPQSGSKFGAVDHHGKLVAAPEGLHVAGIPPAVQMRDEPQP